VSLAAMMHNTCTIERRSTDYDEYGHPHHEHVVSTEQVVCRWMEKLSNLRGLGGLIGEGDQTGWRELIKHVSLIVLPVGTSLSEHDRIVNIKDVNGNVIDEGPFGPLLVRTVYKRRAASHVSAVLEKVF
jgi:hypothetical protein